MTFVASEALRFTADEQHTLQRGVHGLCHVENADWIEAVRLNERGLSGDFTQVGFDDGDGAGRLAVRKSVDED